MAVRVPLQFAKPSMRLARPISDAKGRLIAGAGTRLDERIVRLLRGLAVQSVQVRETDELSTWETVVPVEDALRMLDARLERGPMSQALAELRAAIERHLQRRAARLEAEAEALAAAEAQAATESAAHGGAQVEAAAASAGAETQAKVAAGGKAAGGGEVPR